MSKQPLDRLRSRKQPVSKRVSIITDSDLAENADRLHEAALAARERSDRLRADVDLRTAADDAEEEAEHAREAALESAVWFVVRSLSPRVFEDLKDKHPPTPEQLKEARKTFSTLGMPFQGLGWDIDSFPPALIAACVSFVDVDDETRDESLVPLDESFVKEMYEGANWNKGDVDILFNAAVEVNSAQRVGNMGKGSRPTRS